jgi:hypothetical protein
MTERMAPEAFLAKVEWEGGLWALLTDYGLPIEDVPESIVKLWEEAQHLGTRLERIFDEILDCVEPDDQ